MAAKKAPQRFVAHDVPAMQRNRRPGKLAQFRRHSCEGLGPAAFHRRGERVSLAGSPEDSIDDQLLIGHPLSPQLGAGSRRLNQGDAVGPRDEDNGRGRWIGKRPHRGFISLALGPEAGQRPQARHIAGRRFEKTGPGGR